MGLLVLLDVPLNIYVISVRVHTQSVSVIFVAKVHPLHPDPCLPSPHLKNNNLPTPKHHARAFFLPFRWFPCLISYIH